MLAHNTTPANTLVDEQAKDTNNSRYPRNFAGNLPEQRHNAWTVYRSAAPEAQAE